MQKKILVFSNGEKIGDGLIKLPLLNEIKRRLPEYKIVWMTNRGKTVYNNQLKNIAIKYIDQIIEKANLNPFFWQKISNIYNLKDLSFDYIFDTQKAVLRTLALKRIKCSVFISASAAGFFSDKKIQIKSKKIRKYYLEDLFDLLNLIKEDNIDRKFTIPIPHELENSLIKNYKAIVSQSKLDYFKKGRMVELVDAPDSKSGGSNTLRVRVSLRPPNYGCK